MRFERPSYQAGEVAIALAAGRRRTDFAVRVEVTGDFMSTETVARAR